MDLLKHWPKASTKGMDPLVELYANRRVIVTGGASFIGSHLVDALLEMGCEVTVLDNFSSGKLANLHKEDKNLNIVEIDLESEQNLKSHFEGIDIVFHLAAIHGGRGFIERFPDLVLGNLGLDNNVFKSAVSAAATRIVHASSACAYPLQLQESIGSSYRLSEHNPGSMDQPGAFPDGSYGWTKLIGEYQLRTHTANTRTTGRSARIFTAYGERENESHAAIALIAKALLQMDPYTIWGTGLQTRNFTYVTDTVRGLLNLGVDSSPEVFSIQNIGTSEFVTVNEFINVIFQIIGWTPTQIFRDESKPQGVASRASDNSISTIKFDWEPSVSLTEGLTRTINWYKQQSNRPNSIIDLEKLLESR